MSKKKPQYAQTLVEFALVLPLLLFLIFGLFDLGRAVIFFSALNNAVREGTREGIAKDFMYFYADPNDLQNSPSYVGQSINLLSETCSVGNCQAHVDICNGITGKLFFSDLFDSVVTISYKNLPVDDEEVDTRINIRIEYLYAPITPLVGPLIGNIPINVESEMLLAPVAKP